MNSLRNKNNKKTRIIWLSASVVFVVVLLFFRVPVEHLVAKTAMFVARPFLLANNAMIKWWDGGVFLIESKSSLKQENLIFREKLSEINTRLISYGILQKENQDLKEMLSRVDEGEYAVGAILSRPPKSPYDTLVVDAGFKNGIRTGMTVTAYGDVLLGYVSEVFPKTSKIKLISFPKEELNVVLASSTVSTVAVGRGGANLEITLPRVVEISEGEIVTTPGMESLLIGVVEKVQVDPADPFQKILFRLPVNIQELKYVMIKL